jgi:hypothetical protein
MIGSLMYLTVTRSDSQFTVCISVHFQASLRYSHQTIVQQIFRYLKHTLEFGIPLLLRLVLLAFPMLILRFVALTEEQFWYLSFSWIIPFTLVFCLGL